MGGGGGGGGGFMLRATLQVKRGGSGECLYRISVRRGVRTPCTPLDPALIRRLTGLSAIMHALVHRL